MIPYIAARRWPEVPGLATVDSLTSNPSERATRTSLYEKGMGVIIWLAFATVGIAALYAASLLND